MNVNDIIGGIEKGVAFIETIAPIAGSLGVPFADTVGKAAGAVGEVIENVQTRVAEGTIVANSQDADAINALADRLYQANLALGDYIAKS